MLNIKDIQKRRREIRKNTTPSELVIITMLNNLGIEYKKQVIIGSYIVNFILPKSMIVIEISDLYQVTEKQLLEDIVLKDKFLIKCGFNVIRIDNSNINNFSFIELPVEISDWKKKFGSALGRANAERGKIIQKQRQFVVDF